MSATKARQPFDSIKTETLNKTPEIFSKTKYEVERKDSALTTAKKTMNTLQEEKNKEKLIKQKQEEYQKIVQKFDKVRQCMAFYKYVAKSRTREKEIQKTPESNSRMASQGGNPYKRRLKSSPQE